MCNYLFLTDLVELYKKGILLHFITEDGRWIFKHDVKRAFNAKKIQKCINRYKLKHVAVPDKYVIQVGGIAFSCARMIEQSSCKIRLTVDHIKDIQILVQIVGYTDFDLSNIILSTDNKVYFIDTEDKSFGYHLYGIFFSQAFFNAQLPNIILTYNDALSLDAYSYLKELKEYQNTFFPYYFFEEICIKMGYLILFLIF